jgi:hypothetical protein
MLPAPCAADCGWRCRQDQCRVQLACGVTSEQRQADWSSESHESRVRSQIHCIPSYFCVVWGLVTTVLVRPAVTCMACAGRQASRHLSPEQMLQ